MVRFTLGLLGLLGSLTHAPKVFTQIKYHRKAVWKRLFFKISFLCNMKPLFSHARHCQKLREIVKFLCRDCQAIAQGGFKKLAQKRLILPLWRNQLFQFYKSLARIVTILTTPFEFANVYRVSKVTSYCNSSSKMSILSQQGHLINAT